MRKRTPRQLLENNQAWAKEMVEQDPEFFSRLCSRQAPEYLWIGCSDSRVPANQIVGLLPGEVFVHRNVANLVSPADLNCLSVIQYAVDVLKVKHIIVCGHFECGGVGAVLQNLRLGLVDKWLRDVQDVKFRHEDHLSALPDDAIRYRALCALNVIEQVHNVCRTASAQDAWSRHQGLAVHGWIYDLHDGMLRDLGCSVSHGRDVRPSLSRALETLKGSGGLIAGAAPAP